jgi:hypothetical protein
MTRKEVIDLHTKAWFKFHLQYINENGMDCLNANGLWKWSDYLKEEMNKIIKIEEVAEAANSKPIRIYNHGNFACNT